MPFLPSLGRTPEVPLLSDNEEPKKKTERKRNIFRKVAKHLLHIRDGYQQLATTSKNSYLQLKAPQLQESCDFSKVTDDQIPENQLAYATDVDMMGTFQFQRGTERRGAICKEIEKTLWVGNSVSLYFARTEILVKQEILATYFAFP